MGVPPVLIDFRFGFFPSNKRSLSGWWFQLLCTSVGMMTFPTEWKIKSHVRVTTNQFFGYLGRKPCGDPKEISAIAKSWSLNGDSRWFQQSHCVFFMGLFMMHEGIKIGSNRFKEATYVQTQLHHSMNIERA